MKLKSYINLTKDSNLSVEVQVRLAADAAPAAPFVLLGTLTHEPVDDNLSGAQKHSVSHVIFQHVQEQVFLKHQLQDMGKIRITTGGAFKLPTRMFVSVGARVVDLADPVLIDVTVEPVAATIDGYFLTAENPALVEITVVSPGKYSVSFTGEGETILTVGIANTPFEQMIPIQTTGYNHAVKAIAS
jgi:hypothetical protein